MFLPYNIFALGIHLRRTQSKSRRDAARRGQCIPDEERVHRHPPGVFPGVDLLYSVGAVILEETLGTSAIRQPHAPVLPTLRRSPL